MSKFSHLGGKKCWNVKCKCPLTSLKKLSKIVIFYVYMKMEINGPRQANLVLIAYASSEGLGEPAHPHSLARTFKQWVKRNLQTESQIPSPSECLGMRSLNLSWRNARGHKFAWRGSNNSQSWELVVWDFPSWGDGGLMNERNVSRQGSYQGDHFSKNIFPGSS